MRLKWEKYYLLACMFILGHTIAKSQYNLVLNPSFENFTVCSADITGVADWHSPISPGSKLYFASYADTCHGISTNGVPYNIGGYGYQYARTGSGYIVMYSRIKYGGDKRNYIQTMLNESLKAGHCYYIEFYTNLANPATFATNNIALLVSNSAVQQPGNGTVINETPQIFNYGNPVIKDTLNWVKVSGIYTAQGGERFITIGNFKDDANTDTVFNSSYPKYGDYNFDDVSVIPLDSMPLKADAGRDTTIKLGDSVFIGSLTNGLTGVVWYDANNAVITSAVGVPGFYVKPPLSTFYVIEQTVCGYYSRDTVWVNVNPLPVTIVNYALRQAQGVLRQAQDDRVVINEWTTATEINVSRFSVQRSVNGKEFTTVGKVAANNKPSEYRFTDDRLPLTEGEATLYYRLEMVDRDGSKTYSTIQHINLSNHQELSISPNPARDRITVSAKNIQQIQIINNMGQVALRQAQGDIRQAQGDNGIRNCTINIQQLPRGLYLVQVITRSGEMKTGKLVVSY